MGHGKENARWVDGGGQGPGHVQPSQQREFRYFPRCVESSESFQVRECVIKVVLKRCVCVVDQLLCGACTGSSSGS